MEKGDLKKILPILKRMDNKISELSKLVSSFSISSREDVLIEISRDIIENNKIFQEVGLAKGTISIDLSKDHSLFFIDFSLFSKIKENPSKKLLYLREFLDQFEEISENDKNVILEALKDKDIVDLNKELLTLIKAFKLKLPPKE